MADFRFDIVGFDLDGTLLETHRDLGEAVNHALQLGGFAQVPAESSKDLIGGGAKIMLARAIEQQGGLPEGEFRPLYKEMLRYYAANCAVHTQPYPGALEALAELADRGAKACVVTNKFEGFARDILTSLGLLDRFECVIGGDTLGKGADGNFRAKPLPDPLFEAQRLCGGGSFVFLGDSTYDIRAARAADMPVLAAAYGYCDKAAHELGADGIIDSLHELVPALERL